MIDRVISKNDLLIRLTDERWSHINEEHTELAGMRLDVLETVANPERILQGNYGALLAVREMTTGKYLVVVYNDRQMTGLSLQRF
jgi:hypothetical protein